MLNSLKITIKIGRMALEIHQVLGGPAIGLMTVSMIRAKRLLRLREKVSP
jgi:hypothetical protein